MNKVEIRERFGEKKVVVTENGNSANFKNEGYETELHGQT